MAGERHGRGVICVIRPYERLLLRHPRGTNCIRCLNGESINVSSSIVLLLVNEMNQFCDDENTDDTRRVCWSSSTPEVAERGFQELYRMSPSVLDALYNCKLYRIYKGNRR